MLAVGENGILEGCRRLPDEEKACLLMPECARRYRYLDGLTTMFVVILLVSEPGGAEELHDWAVCGERGGFAVSDHIHLRGHFH